MYKFIPIILLTLFPCYISAEIIFDVEMRRAPEFGAGSLYSHDGKTYIDSTYGSFRVNDFDTKDQYVFINKGSLDFEGNAWLNKDRFVHAYSYHSDGSVEEQTEVDLYDNHGNLINSVVLPGSFIYSRSAGDFPTHQMRVSPSGDHVSFAIGNEVYVYSSNDFELIHWVSFDQYDGLHFSLIDVSEDASKVALYIGEQLFTYDFESTETYAVTKCQEQPFRRIGFTDAKSNELYLIGLGVCFTANEHSEYIDLEPSSISIQEHFYDMNDEMLIIVLSHRIVVFESKSAEVIGEFLVEPFFRAQFDRYDPYARPFLVSNPTYMQDTNFLLALGSLTTASIFKIMLNKL